MSWELIVMSGCGCLLGFESIVNDYRLVYERVVAALILILRIVV